MSTLRSTLSDLATNLASQIIDVLCGTSLEELRRERGGRSERGPGRPPKSAWSGASKSSSATKSGRLHRRSTKEIAAALDEVVGLVRKHKNGLRAEEIRKALKLDVREMPRVLKEGLATKKLKAKGRKRATTYTATT
jgi:hypothetical protein